MSGLLAHYAACDIAERIPAAIRAAGMNPNQRPHAESLAAFDHFHRLILPNDLNAMSVSSWFR